MAAHADGNSVSWAYTRGEYWGEPVRMMQHWSDYLDQLRDGATIIQAKFGAMMRREDAPVLLLLVGLACLLFWLSARRIVDWRRRKREMSDERAWRMGQPVPHDIKRDIARAQSGDFEGEELTPLSYLGYHAGKTKGLRPDARRERLKVCFETEVSGLLPAKYRRWGRPVTYQRYASILKHLVMLANQRRGRSNYEFAVSDWESDATWMEVELGQMARDLRKFGFRR